MAEVFLYHLTRSGTDQTVHDLCVKCRAQDMRVLVKAGSDADAARIDDALWRLGSDTGFLPHGKAGAAEAAGQPILIGTTENASNDAVILMLTDQANLSVDQVDAFQRVCLLFNGNDEAALTQARADWKRVTEAGISAQYWSQESGRWEMKAKSV